MTSRIETTLTKTQLVQLLGGLIDQNEQAVTVYGLSNGTIMARVETGQDYFAIDPDGGITRPGDHSAKRDEVGV